MPGSERSQVSKRSASSGWLVATRRRDLVTCFALAALAFALRGPILDQGLNLADEGYHFYGVQRLAAGQVLYRDVERIYPPGVFYPFVPVIRAFGPGLIATRVVWLIALAVLAIACYALARRLAPWPVAVWVGLLPIALPPPAFKTYVPLCWIAGVMVCTGLLRRRIGFASGLRAGVAIGAIAVFRHDVAAFSLFVAALVAAARGFSGPSPARATARAWFGLACGVGAVVAPILAAFAAQGALGPMLRQLGYTGLRENAEMAIPDALAIAMRAGPADAALFAFPSVALAAGLLFSIRKSWGAGSRAPLAVILALLACAHVHWLQWPGMGHLAQLLPLPALVVASIAGGLAPTLPRGLLRTRLAALTLAGLGAATLAWGVTRTLLPAWRARQESVSIAGPASGARVSPGYAGIVQALVSEVQARTRPGDPIFVAPYAPMLYTLTERANPTRFDLLFPGQIDAAVEDEVIDQLDTSRVRVVVVHDYAWGDRDAGRFSQFAPVFAQYLAAGFRVAARIEDWILYERIVP